ncbi:hypothetical protein [Haloactinospora alba]|uniref:hypothetical protein n=1 Tax=Haloactinospora alba TaxID=405555 RepID=UPI0011508555|nr:hypothetical protein [Haloactinospora alba]
MRDGELNLVLPLPQESAVLAVREMDMPGTAMAQAVDTTNLATLGPEVAIDGYACPATLDADNGGVRTAIIGYSPQALRTWDPFTGALVAETALGGAEDVRDAMAIAAWPARSTTTVFVFGEFTPNWYGWRAHDLRTGQKAEHLGTDDYGWFIQEARVQAVADFLVLPAQTTRFDERWSEVVHDGRLDVFRLPEGTLCGSLDHHAPAHFSTAVVGGRPLLAAQDGVYGLPGLEKVASLPHSCFSGPCTLGEFGGDGVVIGQSPGSPQALAVWTLDTPERSLGEIPVPWVGPTYDLALTEGGTLFAATQSGLYAVPVADMCRSPGPGSASPSKAHDPSTPGH